MSPPASGSITYRIAARRLAHSHARRRRSRGQAKPPDAHWSLHIQVRSTWCTFGHRPLTRRCVILTTNCQVPPAVVLCVKCASDRLTECISDWFRARTGGAHRTHLVRGPWRVGLPTALAPTRTSKIRFEAPVGATDAANRNLLTCIGRDHRRAKPNRGCDRFDCATMKSADARESDSRSSAAHTGLSSLRADYPVPRVARLMALAIRHDQLLRDGVVRSQAELAALERISLGRARRSWRW